MDIEAINMILAKCYFFFSYNQNIHLKLQRQIDFRATKDKGNGETLRAPLKGNTF